MELVSWRDEFPFLKKFIRSPSLLSPMWQKLPYICNNFFYYNNLSITFLNYCTIEKSPTLSKVIVVTMVAVVIVMIIFSVIVEISTKFIHVIKLI